MRKITLLGLLMLSTGIIFPQNNTDISLGYRKDSAQLSTISSESGDLFKLVMHHGPAIENEWMGLRIYFDFKCAIDVYNKKKQGLELAGALWYPTPEQQKEGWGADQYKAGTTVGLGGVRLWDGEKVVFLDPVSMRTARVEKEANISYMEMLSEDVPYKDRKVDILLRVIVFSGVRAAKVEAFALTDDPVQFMTGINYHPKTETKQGNNYICTWGLHPEDVAAFQVNIGAGIIYNPDDFDSITKEEKEYQMISKPCKYLETWIVSASEKEEEINNMDKLIEYLENFKK